MGYAPFKMKYKNLEEVVGELRNAVKAHGKQADTIEKHIDEMSSNKNSPMKDKLKPCQKAAARKKFDVYPSAYANMWASNHKC